MSVTNARGYIGSCAQCGCELAVPGVERWLGTEPRTEGGRHVPLP